MEIEVLTRSKQKGISELRGNSAAFFAKKLNVEKCNYKVYICTKRNLKREGHMGLCAKTGEREITIAVDSNLPLPNILYTLAHEMVQRVRPRRDCRLSQFAGPALAGLCGRRQASVPHPDQALAFKLEGNDNKSLQSYKQLLKLKPPAERAPYEFEVATILFKNQKQKESKPFFDLASRQYLLRAHLQIQLSSTRASL